MRYEQKLPANSALSQAGMEKEMATKVAGILGKKVGMTQLFDSKGDVRPVTVLQAGPCVVTQHKSAGRTDTKRRRSAWSSL